MKRILLLLTILISAASIKAQTPYTADVLMKRVSNADTVYIVNFWATWCVPCVEELPCFDTLQLKYAGKPVKVLLVSMDFKNDYKTKVPAFVKRKNVLPEIVWFNETDANVFIPKIDDEWQGSIPATLIIHGTQFKKFMEGTITVPKITAIVDHQIVL